VFAAVVRDYVMSNMEDGEMKRLQRLFVNNFLRSQDSWEQVTGSRIAKGREFDWYMSSAALQWHMGCAWTKPLADDETAVAWLLSESTVVQVRLSMLFLLWK